MRSGLAAHSPFSRARLHSTHGTESTSEGQAGGNCLRRTLLKKAMGEGTGGGKQAPKRSAGARGQCMSWGAVQRAQRTHHVSVEELTLENHLDEDKWQAKQAVPRASAAVLSPLPSPEDPELGEQGREVDGR